MAQQSKQSENGAVFGRGTSLSLSLSLLALFGTLKFLNTLFLGFCALFVILSLLQKGEKSTKIKENLPFLDTSLTLSMTNLGKSLNLIVCHAFTLSNLAMTDIFTHQKHFFAQILGTKFTNFTRFYGLPRSLCSLAMTANFVILSVATQRVASRKPQQKNPQRLKENLLFLDTSLALSMTNSGFCLKIMDIFTQILKQKFKFLTQNSRHFVNSNHLINSKHCINSTHFITLSQISSHTQGFFISLPQVFAQCKLINFNTRRKNGR